MTAQLAYIYAVTAGACPGVTGLDGRAPVRAIREGGVTVLVSEIQPQLLDGLDDEPVTETGRLASLVRGHDAVVRAAFADGPVLPLRFGTVLRDVAAAHGFARSRSTLLLQELARLDGCAEYRVRVVPTGEPDPATEPSDEPPPETGTHYLTRRRGELHAREEQRSRTRDALARTRAAVGARSVEVAESVNRPGESLLDLSCLVREQEGSGFHAAVEQETGLLAQQSLRPDVTGPWPPYTFARVALAPEGVIDG